MQNILKYFTSVLGMLVINTLFGLAPPVNAQVIPTPFHIVENSGIFHSDVHTKWYTNLEGKEKKMMAEYFQTLPFSWKEGKVEEKAGMLKFIISPLQESSDKEAYRLKVSSDGVEITGNTGAGLFYGIQTLLQLASIKGNGDMDIPCVEVTDWPRFGYRGFMLDVSRHFFPKKFILKMMDMLAYYKINVFHFHLADTGGWRIEMDRYPELTEKTAYRPAEDLGEWWGMKNIFCSKEDKNAYGGYYTKEDIREIVKYAAIRHIKVIPEIDMPGHSRDVLCAFPQLACEGKTYLNSNELCIGNEETFRFCEHVLEEIMELFPSEYIHIGGDEANRSIWNTCPLCKKRMQEENLENVAELQNYFTNRMEKFLHARGKTMIGWDEILDGEVSDRAVVMSWREEVDGSGEALRRGHPVIMAPTSHCYLDYYQDSPYTQPKAFGYISLEKTYSFEPVPEGTVHPSAVWGVQGNLWTEHISTASHAEYMAFPRLLAIAEVGWTDPRLKSYPDFYKRALHAVEYLESKGYHPFPLKNETGPRSRALVPLHHLAFGKKVTYLEPHNQDDLKGAGDGTLTDGWLGNWGSYGSRWQGFYGNMDVLIDLDSICEIHSVETSFMQVPPASLWPPSHVEIYISEDGKKFSSLYQETCKTDDRIQYDIFQYGWKGRAKARYVRFHATRDLTWGNIICDEVIIQ